MFAYYLELGLRSLKRNPILTALMVVGIGLGIAASMTTLTVMHLMGSDPIPWKSAKLHYVQMDNWSPDNPYNDDGTPPDQVTYRDAMALMADEPTGNLDSLMARGVLELLEEINRQGTTIIMVTHDPELAARAQRNVHIIDGQVTDFDDEPKLRSPNRGDSTAAVAVA